MEKEDWWGGRIFEIISLMEFTAAILIPAEDQTGSLESPQPAPTRFHLILPATGLSSRSPTPLRGPPGLWHDYRQAQGKLVLRRPRLFLGNEYDPEFPDDERR
jgi:hypothetical protein